MFADALYATLSTLAVTLRQGAEYLHKPHCLDILSRGGSFLKKEPAGTLAVIDAEHVGIDLSLRTTPAGQFDDRTPRGRHSKRSRTPPSLARSETTSLSCLISSALVGSKSRCWANSNAACLRLASNNRR
jgi:hypothetical protein